MTGDFLKKLLLILLIVGLVATNAITLKLYLDEIHPSSTEAEQATGDELSRVKYFIKDWYDELEAAYGEPKVYYNELRFQAGTYTLTVAADRIRAVYPRGVRTFQLVYVSYIEFYEENGHLFCRMFYNETGESIIRLD